MRSAGFRACTELPFAAGPKAWNKPAQGSALGQRPQKDQSPERARQDEAALSGLCPNQIGSPGLRSCLACPGLACLRTFGAHSESSSKFRTGSNPNLNLNLHAPYAAVVHGGLGLRLRLRLGGEAYRRRLSPLLSPRSESVAAAARARRPCRRPSQPGARCSCPRRRGSARG